MIRWYYYIVRWSIIIFFKIFTRWRIEGLENVPVSGAVLVVPNHLSNADPPLVSVTLKRNAIFMAKEELFHNPVTGYILFGIGAFPVHRGQIDRKALRHAESVLAKEKILVMFPEASRSKTASLQNAFPGSALLALRNNVPIIPVAITGTEKMTNWSWIHHRYPVTIRFGKPYHLPLSGNKNRNKMDLEESTRIIMEHIAELLPEKYRGIYAKRQPEHESDS
jgi:1-acyl-sn-glycerol-3-phosphate acyltransferase